jgi:tetratricopeptide (TPR) repeat protein
MAAGVAQSRQARQDVRELTPNQGITREIRGGESHTYRIFLNKGFFLHATADQRGVDLVLTLRGPSKEKILDNDSTNGAWGPETISWVTDAAGQYEIQVSTAEEHATTGRYELKADIPHPASDSDLARLNAAQLSRKALLLAKEEKPDSWRKAREEYRRVQALWHDLSDSYQEGLSLDMLGSMSILLDDKQEALAEYSKALEIWNLRNDLHRKAEDMELLGTLAGRSGDKDRARRLLEQSLQVRRELKDPLGQASVLNRLGGLYQGDEDRAKALAYYKESLSLLRSLDKTQLMAAVLTNIAALYDDTGQKAAALDAYAEVVTLLEAAGAVAPQAFALRRIASLHEAIGENREALVFYARALSEPNRRVIPVARAGYVEFDYDVR